MPFLLIDLSKFLLGLRSLVNVRVVLFGKLEVSLLEFILGRALLHPEDLYIAKLSNSQRLTIKVLLLLGG